MVLLVADDSPESLSAVDRFIEQVRGKEAVAVDLLNVQTPVSRDVSTFVEEASLASLHHDEGMKALEPARTRVEKAGIQTVVHIGVGDFAHVVQHYAKSLSTRQVYLTATARSEGSDLKGIAEHMGQAVGVPVTVVG